MNSETNLWNSVLTPCRIPRATYRFQFNKGFTLTDAEKLVPYLHELGISDCYASPILMARPGSMHGYDTCDHGVINPEIGGQEAFERFSAALQEHGIGLLLDTVPNHMGINHPSNGWWMEVLENGPSAITAPYFDIDWHPVNPDLDNKVLLPVLEDQYGTVLESGKIQLSYQDGAFYLNYHQLKLPLAPRTYSTILEYRLDALAEMLGDEHDHVLELRSILTALSYLPPRKELPPKKIIERHREKEIIKRRLATLVASSPQVLAAIQEGIEALNGKVGEAQSFDLLDRLLDEQAYRLAFWRVATEEINYRRFFDINELAAVRVEHPRVFRDTHRLIFQLLNEGKATGLRIDHPDGLWNPTHYFRQLQENYVLGRLRAHVGEKSCEGLESEVSARVAALDNHRPERWPPWPLYVVAEKILADNEPLPDDWAVAGTTGYDFLYANNGLFVDESQAGAFDQLYSEFIGRSIDFIELVYSCQKMIMLVSMASEVNALAHQLDRISERNRRYRDFTLNSLTFAIREIIAALLVYRTYITAPETVSQRDRSFVEEAVEVAKNKNPRTAEAIFDFIRDTLLLRNISDFRPEDRPRLVEWTMEFQQVTGPVLAKGLEDTAFYIYNRLVSLNEVGGHPSKFGVSLADFHRLNVDRLKKWPHGMLASATHDTKRSEDVRARLNVLSEIPDQWRAAVTRWSDLNAEKKTLAEGKPAPDRNDEYLLYQTLLGVWPPGPVTPEVINSVRTRIVEYMAKATKEAKVHTSWINPNEEYDAAVREFVCRLLPDDHADPFFMDLLSLQRRMEFFGFFNSLSQTLLKMTCPGVPDFYQGTELWDFSLVDPDNRRPVDYQQRRVVLAELKSQIAAAATELWRLADNLLATIQDGRIKMYAIFQTLSYRRSHPDLFAHGAYVPLDASGPHASHVFAFGRQHGNEALVVAVPRFPLTLAGGSTRPPLGEEIWENTAIRLHPDLARTRFRNIMTGEVISAVTDGSSNTLAVSEVFLRFPIALLEAVS